ncbi:MAG: two-component system, cell cycle response regulator [Bacteroidales bacterium]|jgi:CheY-like chemotaxis protein|nr:two-component system, cell cycle response regulator [Bacteroidales bacterium]MDN5330468.1 two-component system, cell cycle response regulator [Bacteroidales bacterium]NLH53437.1 response regulator [Bacteroidales bacterium]NPV36806.1 response regulator [Bacteroidales bacterium]
MEKLPLKVLYVEDEIIVREPFAEMLSRRVQKVYTAENGEQGLKLYQEFKPDIIITDIKMPVMDGLTMVDRIRATDKQIPVIITTAFEFKDYLKKSIEVGVNKYLVKPIERNAVDLALAEMARLVEFQRANKDYQEFLELMLNTSNRVIIVADFPQDVVHINQEFLHFFGFTDRNDFYSKYDSVIQFFGTLKNKSFFYDAAAGLAWIDGFLKLNGIENNTFLNYCPDKTSFSYNLSFHVFSDGRKVALILTAVEK